MWQHSPWLQSYFQPNFLNFVNILQKYFSLLLDIVSVKEVHIRDSSRRLHFQTTFSSFDIMLLWCAMLCITEYLENGEEMRFFCLLLKNNNYNITGPQACPYLRLLTFEHYYQFIAHRSLSSSALRTRYNHCKMKGVDIF